MTVPSNQAAPALVNYPTHPFCKHADMYRQRPDDYDAERGLKRRFGPWLGQFSSKFPRSMSAKRNAVFAMPANEKSHSDAIEERCFMWKPRDCATRAEYDRYLAWHPPRERA